MILRDLLPVADALLALSQAVHGGTLVMFALLLGFRGLTGSLGTVGVARAFRACGATLGTSLGLFILAAAFRWPFAVNPGAPWPDAFAVPADDPLTVARVGVFVAYWVSYVWLEIWTLDGVRDLDKDGVISDPAAYEAAASRAARHVALNALLFTAIIVLGALGGAP